MVKKQKLKSLITAFTPEGHHLAILFPKGIVKVWNTSDGSLLAEWKQSDENIDVNFSCMACSFVGKKHRKKERICLIALGTDGGDVIAVNVSAGEVKWKSTCCHPGGTASLAFAKEGAILSAVSFKGMATEMNSETGQPLKETKITKKSITSLAHSSDGKIVAAVADKIRVLSLENGEEMLKFSSDLSSPLCIATSEDAKFIITSQPGEKQLQVWKCDFNTRSISSGASLSMKHPPILVECKNSRTEEDNPVVLAVSEVGVAYVWNLNTTSDENEKPTKITVKGSSGEVDRHKSGKAKKNHVSIISARLSTLEEDGQMRVLLVYGSSESPKFTSLEIASSQKDIIITAGKTTMETIPSVQEDGAQEGKGCANLEREAVDRSIRKEKLNKKRTASDIGIENGVNLIGNGDPVDGIQIDDDLNEPTMGEKLANLKLLENNGARIHENVESSPGRKPPSADSVYVLLKQALRADDRALLMDCLYRQDEKVIANSVALLNPSDVLKLLRFLTLIIQSRGAVLTCAISWLRSLLLQHASRIMSQESSLVALNSLFQLIGSRVSNFHPALQLSTSLDLLVPTSDDGEDEQNAFTPIIYEDKDESDAEESDDAMETEPEALSDVSDNDEMMEWQ